MGSTLVYLGLTFLELATIARAVLRPHRDPASRIAWVVVVGALPVAGILAYLLFGETNVGRRRLARARRVQADALPAATAALAAADAPIPDLPERAVPLFRHGAAVSGFPPVGGNRATLTADSDAAIDAIVADVDAAREHVHVGFYIWLADRNGLRVADALRRAAARGVVCRAMADGLGSRALIGSEHWTRLREAGVRVGVALAPGNLFTHPFGGRLDLRNHRKIVVVDGRIAYCGSQNCADPAFLVKAKYAPWVDLLVRFEGPVARQTQHVFVSDWMTAVDEDLSALLGAPAPGDATAGFAAQVVATGPTMRASAMPEVFATWIHAARRELVVTTPYYVPDEAMQAAFCAAAHRGVATTLVVPARNDSWIVAAASRSYYLDLLSAGVAIHEFQGGLLHAKSMTIDGELTLIGSANMDRRSFDLNYENNVLVHDPALTSQVRARQEAWLSASRRVTLEEVGAWSVGRRLWNNTIGMLGPLL